MTEARPPHLLRMGQVLRDSRPKSPIPERIGDYVNLYAATAGPHSTRVVPFEAGINSIALTPGPDGPRRPAILVASSPHKLGLTETRGRTYGTSTTAGSGTTATTGSPVPTHPRSQGT